METATTHDQSHGLVESLRTRLNPCWIRVNLFCGRLFGGPRRSWVIDPMYLYWSYYNRNLRQVSGHACGILLDIGSGNDVYRSLFAPHTSRYFSLDYPAARSVHLAYTDKAKPAVWGDAHELPIRTGSVDTVVSLQVLEHLTRPSEALQEMARVLRPGGKLLLTTHGLYPVHGAPMDYFRYTEFGLQALLEPCGLTSLTIKRNGSFWALWGLMFNQYLFYRCFEQRPQYLTRAVLGALKIALLPVLLVVFAVVNVACRLLDRTHDDATCTSNYTVVAVRGSRSAGTASRAPQQGVEPVLAPLGA